MSFLQILGLIFLAIIVGLIVFVVYIYRMFKKHSHQPEPLQIHLIEDVLPEWLEKKQVIKTKKQAVIELGFTQCKAFTIAEMPNVFVQHFYKDDIQAVIFFHDLMNICWIDFAIFTTDNMEYFSSNAPTSGAIERPPNIVKYMNEDASIKELYQYISTKANELELQSISEEHFPRLFEDSYKHEKTWKVSQGGLSYQEFLQEANNFNKKLSDKKIVAGFTEYKAKELEDWHLPAITEYHKSLENDDFDAKAVANFEMFNLEYSVFMVPARFYAPSFLEYLCSRMVISDEQRDKLQKVHQKSGDSQVQEYTDTFQLFDEINHMFPPDMQATLVHEQDFPLTVRIYAKSDSQWLINHYQNKVESNIK